ncbi:hypothetical protein [Burkholderia ambifaria]|uniref:hypothetical protein n=1 Tax=Burkholderia ambifaria TaxID=152480 RepID=UPI00158A47C8|nr:hypothetical protein [Burkholderia ambifaria]MBR8347503.1 hypothetical protein [Burkholderia ambifaria]
MTLLEVEKTFVTRSPPAVQRLTQTFEGFPPGLGLQLRSLEHTGGLRLKMLVDAMTDKREGTGSS